MRLDVYLATYWPDYSRSQWQKFCRAGYIQVDGKVVTDVNFELGEDNEVTTHIPSQPDKDTLDLPILYEDDDVIVINKPIGVLTHAKGVLTDEPTVADFLRLHTADGLDTNRPGIVHRLDRATSGVLIAAKTTEAKHWLQKQFSDRKVKKKYLAIVQGHLKEPEATLRLPIERNPKQPQTFRVGSNGKAAETYYKVVRSSGDHDLVELWPHTGRTHQLRVHMQYLNHPILGDPLYGGNKADRLYLHAASLEITLPSRQRHVFEAPLPAGFEAAL